MIIGGSVRYEDGVKQEKGDTFSPTRKVAVELNFAVEDGQDALTYTQGVLDTAQRLANEKLGLKTATAAAVKQETTQKPKAPGRKKVDLETVAKAQEAEEIPLAGGSSQGNSPQNNSTQKSSAITSEDDIPLGPSAAGATSAAQSNASGFSLDDLMVEPVAKEISVQEMNNAAAKKMQGSKDPDLSKKILALIGSFNPDPAKAFMAKDIPQSQRQTFLDKLEAL